MIKTDISYFRCKYFSVLLQIINNEPYWNQLSLATISLPSIKISNHLSAFRSHFRPILSIQTLMKVSCYRTIRCFQTILWTHAEFCATRPVQSNYIAFRLLVFGVVTGNLKPSQKSMSRSGSLVVYNYALPGLIRFQLFSSYIRDFSWLLVSGILQLQILYWNIPDLVSFATYMTKFYYVLNCFFI